MKNIGLILISVALILTFRPDVFTSVFYSGNDIDESSHDPIPTMTLQKVILPIRKTSLHHDDAKRLTRFYLALANVIERDRDGIIKSSAEVRLINERSGRLCFERTGIAGRYPHLAKEIDAVIGYGIGSKQIDGKWESVEITSVNRRGLVESLQAIAWACQNAALESQHHEW